MYIRKTSFALILTLIAVYLHAQTPGTLKWVFETNGIIDSSPAIGADGIIYIGSFDDNLYAINPDGTEKWVFETDGDVNSSPAIGADGTIYVGSFDDNLYAINPDGTEKWVFETGGNIFSSPAIGADGTIYVGSFDDNLYAINPDGTELWTFEIGSDILSSPAVDNFGTVYIGSWDNNLYAINPDGTQKWIFQTGGWVNSSPAINTDGTIYIGSTDANLYAINPDGTIKWVFATGGGVNSSPTIDKDGTVYVGSWDNNLYAINPDGTQKWIFQTGGWVNSTPAIGEDSTIYFGSCDLNCYAINSNGSQKWIHNTAAWIISSPAISIDGIVYIGSDDKKLHAIYSNNIGLVDSQWPKFNQNNQNTGQAPPIKKDLGVSYIQLSSAAAVGVSNTIQVTISNYGTESITNTPVGYQIDSGALVNETYTGVIDPGSSENYIFSTDWSPTSPGNYTIKAYTSYPEDEYTANDTLTKTVHVVYTKDIGIFELLVADTTAIGVSNTIQATISNYGTEAASNSPVSYQIDEGAPVNETYTGTINPGSSVNHAFSTPWIPSSLGDNTIKAYTAYAEDENTANDTLTKTVCVAYQNDVGISEILVPSSVGVNRTVAIKVELTNDGIEDQNNFPVSYKIGSGSWITETYSGSLASQQKAVYSFSQTWTPASLGSYTIYARTGLNGDQNASNDNKQKNVTVADAAYIGTWEGTTSQNERPFNFHVNGDDEIDSLSVEIRVDFGSFSDTRIWHNRDVVPIENDTFRVEISSPNIYIVSGCWPVVHGEFTDGTICNGTISSFVVMSGNSVMGTPLTNSSKTWTAERTGSTKIVDRKGESIPSEYMLFQNYPNPFNPETTIEYQLPKQSYVSLKVFNISGREVLTLVNGEQPQGHYQIKFDSCNLPSGTYFYQLKTDDQILCRRMLILK